MKLMKRNNGFVPSYFNLFDDYLTKEMFDYDRNNYCSHGSTLPSVNIKESNDEFSIELAAPGMNKKDFSLKLDNNILEITAEIKNDNIEDSEGYSRREFNYSSFKRSFKLPKDSVKNEKVAANYENGILKVLIPKREEVKPKPSRMIEIQ